MIVFDLQVSTCLDCNHISSFLVVQAARQVCRALLVAKADPRLLCADAETPLHWAAALGHQQDGMLAFSSVSEFGFNNNNQQPTTKVKSNKDQARCKLQLTFVVLRDARSSMPCHKAPTALSRRIRPCNPWDEEIWLLVSQQTTNKNNIDL